MKGKHQLGFTRFPSLVLLGLCLRLAFPGLGTHAEPSRPSQVVLLSIGRFGFQPAQLTMLRGALLRITNRGGSELNLVLAKENRQKVHDVRFRPKSNRWTRTLDLPPGTYVLSDPNRPDLVCRITVLNK